MNRRTFVRGSVAAITLVPMLTRVSAEDAISAATWDDVSGLYGNVWDVLPKAAEGNVELVAAGVAMESGLLGGPVFCGVTHNNTDESKILIQVHVSGASKVDWITGTPSLIPPHSYAMARCSVTLEEGVDRKTVEIEPVYVARDGIGEAIKSDPTISGYSFDPTVEMLRVNSAERTDSGLLIDITNPLKDKTIDTYIDGFVLWFDAESNLKAEQSFSLHPEDALAPGASYQEERELSMSNVEPDARFLLAISGWAE